MCLYRCQIQTDDGKGRNGNQLAPLFRAKLGWGGTFIPLSTVLLSHSLWLLAGGGCLYSFGIIFYCRGGQRYTNVIWHGLIVIALACFFLGIMQALATTVPVPLSTLSAGDLPDMRARIPGHGETGPRPDAYPHTSG